MIFRFIDDRFSVKFISSLYLTDFCWLTTEFEGVNRVLEEICQLSDYTDFALVVVQQNHLQ